jgi:hypothetical protein
MMLRSGRFTICLRLVAITAAVAASAVVPLLAVKALALL